jgi:hypothetical protein
MMKKSYLTTETIETVIELQMMIAGSTPKISNEGNEEDEADPEGEVLSRRRVRNQWDDEELYEEELEEEEEW